MICRGPRTGGTHRLHALKGDLEEALAETASGGFNDFDPETHERNAGAR